MDNWQALFDGQTRYTLDINDSTVQPDVLNFHGREALSEPFRRLIEFTTPQSYISGQDVLMKYAPLMQYLCYDDAPVVDAPFTADLVEGPERTGNPDGAGCLHLIDALIAKHSGGVE